MTRGKTNVWRGINRARDKKKRKLGFASPVPKKDESEAADDAGWEDGDEAAAE